MRYEEFFENVDITDEDKERADCYFKSKGVEKHIILKDHLLSWKENNEIEYSEIASVYRYDKRIRNVLYKFIAYLEEYYRAIILDKYYNSIDERIFISNLKDKLQEHSNNLNFALENLMFRDLLKQTYKLEDEINENILVKHKKINQNINALITLRNAVMHNKFLIMFRGYNFCYISLNALNEKDASLKSNIINLGIFLPDDKVRNALFDEINKCAEDKKETNTTKWNLPNNIIIKFR